MNPHIFQAARLHSPIEYRKPDGVFSFDVPTSLHRFVNIHFDYSVQLSFNFCWVDSLVVFQDGYHGDAIIVDFSLSTFPRPCPPFK
jgi:hypothetical protein